MNNNIFIDIGGTKMLISHKNIKKIIPTGIKCTKNFIKKQIKDFLHEIPAKHYKIGIAIPGLVKNFNHVILSYVIPDLKDLTTDFIDSNQEIHFINDVTAALFSQFDKFDKLNTIIVIMVGTGIGMGIFSNNKIITGANGWAGELGSTNIIIDSNNVQTLDQVASGAAIIKLMNNKSPEEIKKLLDINDQSAIEIIKKTGFYFGIGLANVINLYNPNLIVISGGTSNYKYYIESALKSAQQFSIDELYKSCKIKIIKTEENLVIKGLENFLKLQNKSFLF